MPAARVNGRKISYNSVPGEDASSPFFGRPNIGSGIPSSSMNPVLAHEKYEQQRVTDPRLGAVRLPWLYRVLGLTNRYSVPDKAFCRVVGNYAHRKAREIEVDTAKREGRLSQHLEWRIHDLENYIGRVKSSSLEPPNKLATLTKLQEDLIFFKHAAWLSFHDSYVVHNSVAVAV